MASSKDYLEYVLEQLSEADDVTSRAMMSEYILYFRGKVIGGIYDNRFLVKPVQAALIFPTSQYVSRRRFAGKFSTFGAVRGPRRWSVLLRKKQARSTQGTRIASEKSLMKQEIIPQGVHLLLFCAARLFLLPFRSC